MGQLRDYESSSFAFVILSEGSSPFLAEIRVLDIRGDPIVGAELNIRNNSGGNGGTSDINGCVKIMLGETDIEGILLDGRLVLNRPDAYALGYPSVERGLCILIVKKGGTPPDGQKTCPAKTTPIAAPRRL